MNDSETITYGCLLRNEWEVQIIHYTDEVHGQTPWSIRVVSQGVMRLPVNPLIDAWCEIYREAKLTSLSIHPSRRSAEIKNFGSEEHAWINVSVVEDFLLGVRA